MIHTSVTESIHNSDIESHRPQESHSQKELYKEYILHQKEISRYILVTESASLTKSIHNSASDSWTSATFH